METLTSLEIATLGGILGSTLIISALLYVLLIIAGWQIFKKAGEPGWKILIPIYNIYIMFKIVKMKNWFWTLFFLACVQAICCAFIGVDPALQNAETINIDWAANAWFLIVALVISCISVFAGVLYAWRTSKVFGHGCGFAIGLIFLPNLFWLIIGLGKSKYNKKALKK